MKAIFDPKFYTKQGRLNRYALACGYVERAESDYSLETYRSVELSMSGSVIHVLTYERMGPRRKQFCTNNMKQARAVFAEQCKALGVSRTRL